ncbi:hypothetical protein GJ744_007052 [Endocarpon pusillum]|uniref:Uncharacterized protein n=1 Tax=Endocarpon pusillum TaxID=364733 RepID=A0A8H7AJB5_9EURO|nr:hypothetical protein GJ744_007052 [Endocarpon pusillum]
MCRVTRIRNSCGHINDHVEMACRDAKPESPTKPGAVLVDTTNRAAQTSSPRYRDPSKLARPISPSQAASDSSVSLISTPDGEDRQHGSFHASTQPHCKKTQLRVLTLQNLVKDYECMVEGCGQIG